MTEHSGASLGEARNMDAADGGDGLHPAAASDGANGDEVVAEQTDGSTERSERPEHVGRMSIALRAFLLIQAAFLVLLIWWPSRYPDVEAGFVAFSIIFSWVVADLVLTVCYGIWKWSDPDRNRK
jgi:hypothetical protein